mmetsp:Transcript_42378/g.111625  ORF Transcript_42378/g.111625 Transcript_42378/m.111625 type:complete len:640 (+) Transcript_42378:3-1922(+)
MWCAEAALAETDRKEGLIRAAAKQAGANGDKLVKEYLGQGGKTPGVAGGADVTHRAALLLELKQSKTSAKSSDKKGKKEAAEVQQLQATHDTEVKALKACITELEDKVGDLVERLKARGVSAEELKEIVAATGLDRVVRKRGNVFKRLYADAMERTRRFQEFCSSVRRMQEEEFLHVMSAVGFTSRLPDANQIMAVWDRIEEAPARTPPRSPSPDAMPAPVQCVTLTAPAGAPASAPAALSPPPRRSSKQRPRSPSRSLTPPPESHRPAFPHVDVIRITARPRSRSPVPLRAPPPPPARVAREAHQRSKSPPKEVRHQVTLSPIRDTVYPSIGEMGATSAKGPVPLAATHAAQSSVQHRGREGTSPPRNAPPDALVSMGPPLASVRALVAARLVNPAERPKTPVIVGRPLADLGDLARPRSSPVGQTFVSGPVPPAGDPVALTSISTMSEPSRAQFESTDSGVFGFDDPRAPGYAFTGGKLAARRKTEGKESRRPRAQAPLGDGSALRPGTAPTMSPDFLAPAVRTRSRPDGTVKIPDRVKGSPRARGSRVTGDPWTSTSSTALQTSQSGPSLSSTPNVSQMPPPTERKRQATPTRTPAAEPGHGPARTRAWLPSGLSGTQAAKRAFGAAVPVNSTSSG